MKKNQFKFRVAISAAMELLVGSTIRTGLVKHLALISFAIASLLLTDSSSSAIDFNFFYTDAAGQGFFNPVDGDQRRAAMDAAGGIIGQLIRPSFGDEAVTVRVNSYSEATNDKLASARPAFFYSNFATSDPRFGSDTQYPKALASHFIRADIEPDHDDVTMNVNFGYPYYFGTDALTPDNQYDFVSVVMHELIHGLGFYGSFREQGGYGVYGDGTYDSEDEVTGFAVAYDRFITVGPYGCARCSHFPAPTVRPPLPATTCTGRVQMDLPATQLALPGSFHPIPSHRVTALATSTKSHSRTTPWTRPSPLASVPEPSSLALLMVCFVAGRLIRPFRKPQREK